MPFKDIERKRALDRNRVANRRAEWISAQGGRCSECGSTDRLEVDHVDPSTKICNPTQIWSRSAAFREAELAKCQVLCADCHKAKTLGQFDTGHGTSYQYHERRCRCALCRAWNAARGRRQRARSTRGIGSLRRESK